MNRSACRGLAMVEMALVLPLLLTIFFGITELGRALYQQNILSKNVAHTARMLARSYEALDVENSCATNPAVWPAALSNAENFLLYGRMHVDESDQSLLANTVLESVDITTHANTGSNIAEVICTLTVTASSTFTPIVSDVFGIGEFTLTASAEERYIGE